MTANHAKQRSGIYEYHRLDSVGKNLWVMQHVFIFCKTYKKGCIAHFALRKYAFI